MPADSRVTVRFLRPTGVVAEEHRMEPWEVERTVGELAGRFRDAHGWTPYIEVALPDGRDGRYLLPRQWR